VLAGECDIFGLIAQDFLLEGGDIDRILWQFIVVT